MARPVDEKIVRMKMENQDFVSKASETGGILSKLQNALNKIPGVNLGKTSNELAGIGKEMNNVPANKLLEAVENISGRFSTMGIIATTALVNIANRAVDTGMKLAKSLTMDGITQGFGEYELKMGSIQTILANTSRHGTTLKDVSLALNDLNEYADKTIYNFAEMTKNIGLFTNAGMNVDEATSMIKGFSNEAAASGTTSQGAAGAAYQLSQALSAGTIRLMDWRSLTNVGMGNKNMQNGLIEVADAMGTLNKTGAKASEIQKNFNYSLEKNWLSADVMSTYLRIMAGDIDAAEMATLGLTKAQIDMFVKQQKTAEEAATKVRTFTQLIGTAKEAIGSGWAQTWELLLGDFDQATELLSGVSEVLGGIIGNSANARNELLEAWSGAGGRRKVIEGLGNIFTAIFEVVKSIGSAFKEIFPPVTLGKLLIMTNRFLEFTKRIQLSTETTDKLKTVFKGVFSIFDTGFVIAKKLGGALMNLIPKGVGGDILDMAVAISEFLLGINESVKSGNKLTEFIDGLGVTFKNMSQRAIVFKETLQAMYESGGAETITSIFERMAKALGKVRDVLGKAGSVLKEFVSGITLQDVGGALFTGGIFLFGKKLFDLIDKLFGIIRSPLEIKSSIQGLFGTLGDSLEAFTARSKYSNLLKVAVALGILAVSLKLLENISWPNLGKGLVVLGVALGGLVLAFGALTKLDITGFGGAKIAITLMAMAVAISLIAAAITRFEDTDTTQLAIGMVAVGGIMLLLVTSIKLLSRQVSSLSAFDGAKIAVGLLALSISVGLMTISLKALSKVNGDALIRGGAAITLITTVLIGTFAILGQIKAPTISAMASFIAFTIGLQGAAVSLVIFAGALHLLIPAVEKIGKMDLLVLKQGLTGMIVALLGVSAAMKIAKGSFSGSVGLLVAVGAIALLLPIVDAFGNMDTKVIGTGMITIGGALVILVAALKLASGSLTGAAALTIAAIALNLLVVPLMALGNMSVIQVVTALVALGGALALIGGVAALFTPIIPAIIGFAAAISLIGVGVILAGAGLTLLGTALVTFVGVGASAISLLMTTFETLLDGLIGLGPKLASAMGVLIVSIANAIITSSPKIVVAAGVLILSLLDGIVNVLPKVVVAGVLILLSLINGFSQALPVLIAAAIGLMVNFIAGLSSAIKTHGPVLIKEILGLIGEVLAVVVKALIAVLDAFIGWVPGVTEALGEASDKATEVIRDRFDGETLGAEMGTDLTEGIKKQKPVYRKSGKEVGTELERGVLDIDMKKTGDSQGKDFSLGATLTGKGSMLAGMDLSKNLDLGALSGDMLGTGKELGTDFATGIDMTEVQALLAGTGLADSVDLGANSADLLGTGKEEGKDFATGVASKKADALAAGKTLANNSDAGAKTVSAYGAGTAFGRGFANGITAMQTNVRAAAEDLANVAIKGSKNKLMVRSPSKIAFSIGGFFGDGLAGGIIAKAKNVKDAATDIAGKALESMHTFVDELADAFIPKEEEEYEFKLKPILDLDNMNPYPDQTFKLSPDTSRPNVQFREAVNGLRQNGNTNMGAASTEPKSTTVVTQNYEIKVTATGDLPMATIKKMAVKIQDEIKNINDREKMSRGEAVTY